MKSLSILSLLAMLALLVGCAGDETVSTEETAEPGTEATSGTGSETPETVVASDNKNCPIMGHAVTADGGSVKWNGKTIGFCCDGCKPEFEKLSDEDKTAKLAEADKTDHGESEEGEAEEKPAETTES